MKSVHAGATEIVLLCKMYKIMLECLLRSSNVKVISCIYVDALILSALVLGVMNDRPIYKYIYHKVRVMKQVLR